MSINLENTYAVILCGGLGTRLRKIVQNRPKAMAFFGKKPFLDFLIDYLERFNIKNVIFCTGYMGDVIKKYYIRKKTKSRIIISYEKKPQGTAGAIKNAEVLIKSDPFFVLNGDSMCKINLKKFLQFHVEKNALVSIVLTKSTNKTECGLVFLDAQQKILQFREKDKFSKSNLINAGIYLFNKEIINYVPVGRKFSFEYDLFPLLKRCYGYVTNKVLIDIGTPKGYKQAQKILANNKK